MDELTDNPDNCTKFEQNPFKKEKCKHCGHLWTAHKGVIDPKVVEGYVKAKQKVFEDKQKADAQAKAAAVAAKAAKKASEQAVEDAWLFEGDPADATPAPDDSDDDMGFRMFTAAEMGQGGATPAAQSQGNKPLKVTNLIDFSECDVQEEDTSCRSTAPSASAAPGPGSANATPDSDRIGDTGTMGALQSEIAAHVSTSGQDTASQLQAENEALKSEMEYMKQMLNDLKQETTIQVEIVRDEVTEKEAQIQELKKQKQGLEQELQSLRGAKEAGTAAQVATRASAPPTGDVLDASAEAREARLQAILAIREVRAAAEQRLAGILGRMKTAAGATPAEASMAPALA
eukprot:TRINITY_DN12345_c0_g1_i1.p1 TRINITY_DN12345_c0_g1~~TRINITY_DN12345_c0_g1_i1.p1  ORF type:complete len:345 (+),score=100.69 TRINITY_DN12345_c0_g1_i1:106-1140(+)